TRPIPYASYQWISARRSSPLAMRTVAIPLLGVELPWLDEVVRARRPERLPVVLTRDEVRAALGRLDGPARLMACLLYGAGLRVPECCSPAVKEEPWVQRRVLAGRGDVTADGRRPQGAEDRRPRHRRGAPIRHSLAEVSRAVYHESGDKEIGEEIIVANYIPSPRQWVREQVELYEGSGGKEGTTLRDTGLPVIIVTHTGNKTGAIRKTPLMRVKDGTSYVLVGSLGGAPKHPVWVYNLRANPAVELRDHTTVQTMRVREVKDEAERARLWKLAVAAYPPYADYQMRTTRRIPIFVAEPEATRRASR